MSAKPETLRELLYQKAYTLIEPVMCRYTTTKEKIAAIQVFSRYWDKAMALNDLSGYEENYRVFFTEQISEMLRAFPEDVFDPKHMHLEKIELTEHLVISLRTTITQDQDKREAKMNKAIAMVKKTDHVLETTNRNDKAETFSISSTPEKLSETVLFTNDYSDKGEPSLESILQKADSEYQSNLSRREKIHGKRIIQPIYHGK